MKYISTPTVAVVLLCLLVLGIVVGLSSAYTISADANTKYINVTERLVKCGTSFMIEDDEGNLYSIESFEYSAVPNINTYNELKPHHTYLVQLVNKWYITNVIEKVV